MNPQNVDSLTQEQIAQELGVSTETIRRLKKLQTLSPDLQQLIENGSVKLVKHLDEGQRGVGNVNPMKMAKCIKELERIYGIYNGNHKIKELNNSTPKNQTDLANQFDIDRTQYLNYKKLNELIPELQELVENNQLKATTAYKIWAKMPQEEQEKNLNNTYYILGLLRFFTL
ncbi:sigma factor-like helix-turn-helix DNA-binding protein [Haloimpatiens massiliensis]|uniref:sigma factor-like helix-turn-helix DNA-binding protein n=1 Tax=Haloimpatiens massiliensis TaxID=1658110 RepID=UPI000C821164|nr:helix-turn-helix domain-containing protein [Haloimpatiens massiliensis]